VSISVPDTGLTLATGSPENTLGPINLDSSTSSTTANGNIGLNLVSTITANTAGAGEELAAGSYSVGIKVTVTAQ
jgi:hypothetical protein